MILYRIARERYARDLSGNGGLVSSARWHDHLPVIYTAFNSSTCILETLVHLMPEEIHNDLQLITIDAADKVASEMITPAQLPPGWKEIPGPPLLKQLGNAWLRGNTAALLIVPSAVDPLAQNVLINPLHPDISHISVKAILPFTYDQRLLTFKRR